MNSEDFRKKLLENVYSYVDPEELEKLLYGELTLGKSKWVIHTNGSLS